MEPNSSQPKKLYRDMPNKMIMGVCSGLAEHLNLDPTLVRIIFVLFTLAGGSGILAYVIMMLIIPEKPVG